MAHTKISADPLNALERLDVAVRVRAAGDTFDLVLRLDDDRGSVAAVLAKDVCQRIDDLPTRRAELERIGNANQAVGQNPLLGLSTMDLATKATVRDLAMLANTLIFRSWAEMRRAVMTFDIVHHAYSVEAPSDPAVPEPIARDPHGDGSIVIWAPDEPAERLYIVMFAAAETGRVVRVVCRGGDLAHIPVEVVPLANAADALSHASVCVAASMSDPSPAIALAKWGIPLNATFTSGAYEWVEGVVSYRPWSVRSVAAAIATALGTPSPRVAPSTPPNPVVSKTPRHDAYVAIVVRSPSDTASTATIDSIARQSHASIDTTIAASTQAVRDALDASTATYVAFLQDGDVLFPDAIAQLVDALEKSEAQLAYAGGLLAYVVDAPGVRSIIGYSILERMPVWARTMSAGDEFAGTYFRVLFRRNALAQMGLDEHLDDLLIYDAFLRMLTQMTAIHVDSIAGMSFRFLDGRIPGNGSVDIGLEYERIWNAVPAPDAAVSAAREAVRLQLLKHGHIGVRPPPQRLNPPQKWR